MPEPLPVFIERREASWAELRALVTRSKGRITNLDPAGVRQLGLRYREAVADLAHARRRFPADGVTRQLEALVGAARPLVYGSVVERQSIVHFATTGYWRRLRECPVFLLVAAAALWLPIGVVAVWAHGHPTQAAQVAQISPLSANLGEQAPRDPDTEKETDVGVNLSLSSQIFTNNARVALVAYAGGLTGGVLTLVALLFNSVILGLVAGLTIEAGYGDSFWRLIPPHGVLELSLLTAAGAAGLRTGWALLHPGHRTRAESLAVEGRAGVEMALGTAVLLVPLGFVEGFLSVRGLSLPMAIAVGLGLGGAFWAMVLWRGRPPTGERAP